MSFEIFSIIFLTIKSGALSNLLNIEFYFDTFEIIIKKVNFSVEKSKYAH